MANYTQLIQTINDNIKANGNQEITGPVLNAVLQAIVKGMSEGALFAGIADTTTNPPAYDGNVFYIAIEPGNYTNFGVDVPTGSIGVLHNMGGGNKWDVSPINTYYAIDVDTLMQGSPSSDDIDEAIGGLSNLKRAITAGVPFFGRSASGDSTVAIAQVKQLGDNEVRVVMLNTGTIDGSNELVPIIKKITVSAGQLSLSTEAPTSFIGPLSSLSTNEKGSVVGAINEVNTGLKSAVKPYVVDLTDLLAAQDSESISTAIGGIDNLNGTVQKNQVIFGTLANGTVAVGIRVLGNQTTLTYFVDSVVGLTVNEIIITNTSGTLTKTANTHAVITENMVVNNLESDEATLPLSAAQGKALNEKIQSSALYVINISGLYGEPTSEEIDTAIGGWDNLLAAIRDSKLIVSAHTSLSNSGNFLHFISAFYTTENYQTISLSTAASNWDYDNSTTAQVLVSFTILRDTNGALRSKVRSTTVVSTDNTLSTTDKTVIGAINEVNQVVKAKQDKLRAGTGVEITSDNTVNVTLDTTVFKVVASLPESPAAGDENKIFLVPAESTEEGNIYTEYVFVNGKWEEFGTYRSEVDLTLYLKKTDAETTYQKINDNTLATKAKTVVGAINEVKSLVDVNSDKQYLHKVYEEYGAVYNDDTGYWEYGDLKDMTEEDCFLAAFYALEQIQGSSKMSYILDRYGITQARTYFTKIYPKGDCNATKLCLNACFALNSKLEYLKLSTLSTSSYLYITNIFDTFSNCPKLRKIEDVLSFSNISSTSEAFTGCIALRDVKVRLMSNANTNVSFQDSPLLSYESLNYLVTNATNTKAITVTVHPTTYSYLTGTAQPTEEVGGTAEEWQALVTTAQGKQISFAQPA